MTKDPNMRALSDRLDRAERALTRAGFTDQGGQEWKPPLGKMPIARLVSYGLPASGGGNMFFVEILDRARCSDGMLLYDGAFHRAAPEAPTCTCPSGDGSLRWPCPAHPPEANAASAIKTWQERTGNHNVRPGSVKHMIAEIAELRAALARAQDDKG